MRDGDLVPRPRGIDDNCSDLNYDYNIIDQSTHDPRERSTLKFGHAQLHNVSLRLATFLFCVFSPFRAFYQDKRNLELDGVALQPILELKSSDRQPEAGELSEP